MAFPFDAVEHDVDVPRAKGPDGMVDLYPSDKVFAAKNGRRKERASTVAKGDLLHDPQTLPVWSVEKLAKSLPGTWSEGPTKPRARLLIRAVLGSRGQDLYRLHCLSAVFFFVTEPDNDVSRRFVYATHPLDLFIAFVNVVLVG